MYRSILGFFPKRLELYEQAFLHSSAKIKDSAGRYINNERLEFLGDSALDSVISKYLFDQFDVEKEGFLSKMRSKIVNRDNLNRISYQLGLHNMVKSNIEILDDKNDILGNTLEALIGAILLDRDFKHTEKFIYEKIITPYIDIKYLEQIETNHKGKLIEWAQKKDIDIRFSTTEKFAKDNLHLFICEITLNEQIIGKGLGKNKKEAQKSASKNAWNNINENN